MITGHFMDADLPVVDGVVRTAHSYRERMEQNLGPSWLIAPRYPGLAAAGTRRVSYLSIPFRAPYRIGLAGLDRRIGQRLAKVPFDVVHSHSPFGAGALAARTARRRGCPHIFTLHSRYPDWSVAQYECDPRWLALLSLNAVLHGRLGEVASPLDLLTQTARGRRLARVCTERVVARQCARTDCVLVPSERLRREVRAYAGMAEGVRVEVVRQGIDFPAEAPGRRRIRQEFAIASGVPMFLYVGQLSPEKEVHFLLEALARLAGRGQDFAMVFVGDGPLRAELETLAQSRGIAERVHFAGVVRDKAELADFYDQADLFLFPSLYETQGLVATEAASFGLPVVAQHGAPGISDVFTDGVDAAFAARSVDAYATLVGSLACNLRWARRLGVAARRQVMRVEETVRQVSVIYWDLAARTGTGANFSRREGRVARLTA